MRITLFFLLILSTFICKSQITVSSKDINVLFIGNSLTYFHEMPKTVQEMVNETNPNIKIYESTFPGISLASHLDDVMVSSTANHINTRKKEEGEVSETEKKLFERKWDFVILQDGTVRLLIPEARLYLVETAISRIKKLIQNPDCNFILFQTWPSKDVYPKQYCYSKYSINQALQEDEYCSPKINSLENEIRLINESYELVAKHENLIASFNGNKFYEIITNHPEIELYEDSVHPNKYGAFLNASIFYKMLTGKKAVDLTYSGEIEQTTATLLKKVADK